MPRSRSRSSSSSSRSSSSGSSSHRRHGHKRSRRSSQIPEIMRRQDEESLRKRLFVANIRRDFVSEDNLRSVFALHGTVTGLNITPRGYAFVQFETEEEARRAAQAENGNMLKGSRLVVHMALERRKPHEGSHTMSEPRERSPIRGRFRGRGRGFPPSRGYPPGRDGYPPDDYPLDDYPLERDMLGPHDYPPARGYSRRHPVREPRDPRDPRDMMDMLHAREMALKRREMLADPIDRRDPYYDDPYRRLPPLDYDRHDSRLADPYRRDLPPAPQPSLPPPKPPAECQIIILNQQLRTYGDAVERRIKNIGIFTESLVLPPERTLQEAIDDVTNHSFLFAVVVTQQNETHRSLTLNILHGKPQVHRNMPLDDCITLIEKSFEKYLTKKKEEAAAAKPKILLPDATVSYLLHLLADNRPLTKEEITKVIKYLKERRSMMDDTASAQSSMVNVEEPKPQVSQEDAAVVTQRQQLQDKINNLFPAAKPAPPKTSVTSLVNFDNPNVQKALDNLIQNPGVLQNLGSALGISPPQSGSNSVASPAQQRAQQAQMFAATERTQLARPPHPFRFNRPL